MGIVAKVKLVEIQTGNKTTGCMNNMCALSACQIA